MILNAYAVLDIFLVLLRLVLGLLVLWLGGSLWKQSLLANSPERQKSLENRGYLVFLLAIVLLGINLVSWPILYLLLESYIPQWPGVMCIYGVTRVGAGSIGTSRFLPALLDTLQVAKPVLVFLSGAWFILYLIDRRTQTSPLRGRLLMILTILGLLAIGDAVVEAAYIIIPKKEEFLSSGCCTEAFDVERSSRFLPQALVGEDYHPWLYGAYYGINFGMVLGLFLYTHLRRHQAKKAGLALLFLGAVVSLPVNAIFLVEIAAPTLLQLRFHFCPYDLLPRPECVVGIGLYVLGCFSVGWAVVASWLGRCQETKPFLQGVIEKVLSLGQFGYLASVVMMILELLLAQSTH